MRLTIVIHAISRGGAERAAATLANHWAGQGWQVTVLTFDDGSSPSAFELHPNIIVTPLDVSTRKAEGWAKVGALSRVLRRLRAAIDATQPDAVLSFMTQTNVLTLLATIGRSVPVVVSEQGHPATNAKSPGERLWPLRMVGNALRDRTYARAATVVVQTRQVREHYPKRLHGRMAVIANPVVMPEPGGAADVTLPHPVVVSMGRLDVPKRFDLLIDAFAELAPSHPQWTLAIVGDGPLRGELEERAARHGLGERILFPGLSATPHAVLEQADAFVFASDSEGFPGVLCEALASGCPTVATACPCGPAEIVHDGEDGLLVPPADLPALSAALERVLSDEDLRKRLAERAPSVLERYGLERVAEDFASVLRAA